MCPKKLKHDFDNVGKLINKKNVAINMIKCLETLYILKICYNFRKK